VSFPTTPILDTFPYATGDLNSSGSWIGPVAGTSANLRVGDLAPNSINATAAACSDYYSVAQYGPNCESYIDIPVVAPTGTDSIRVWARMQNPLNAATFKAYDVSLTAAGTWTIVKTINGTRTTIATFTQAIAAGDKFGIQVIGTTVSAWWYNNNDTIWHLVGAVENNEVVGVGYLGVRIFNVGWQLDNFGGGSAAEVGGPVSRLGWP
jgi:hypothetical protein